MAQNIQVYAKMADETAAQITGSYQEWTAFLTTAARLYKYPYHEQLMIYAQRPEATACASYDLWNRRMGRYVRRGSRGIALIDMTGDRPKIRYVFDVADTGRTERSRRFENTDRSTGRPFPPCWSGSTVCPVKTVLRNSLKRSPPSEPTNTGMTTGGIFSASLTIRFFTGMMIST